MALAQKQSSQNLDEILAAIKREAVEMLLSRETGFITIHFDGKCGVRHEINRKGELMQVALPEFNH